MQRESTQDKYAIAAADDQTGLESGRQVFRGAQRRPRYYKPLATKSPCLILILGAILICIVILEVVLHQGTPYTKLQQESESHKTQVRRQATAAATTTAAAAATTTAAAAATTTAAAASTLTEATTASAAALSLTSPTTTSASPTTSSSLSTSDAVTGTTEPGAALTLTSPTTTPQISESVTPTETETYFSLSSGGYLTLTSPTTTPQPTETQTTGGGYLTLTSPTTTPQPTETQTTGGTYLILTSPTTTSSSKFESTTNGYLKLSSPTTTRSSSTIAPTLITTAYLKLSSPTTTPGLSTIFLSLTTNLYLSLTSPTTPGEPSTLEPSTTGYLNLASPTTTKRTTTATRKSTSAKSVTSAFSLTSRTTAQTETPSPASDLSLTSPTSTKPPTKQTTTSQQPMYSAHTSIEAAGLSLTSSPTTEPSTTPKAKSKPNTTPTGSSSVFLTQPFVTSAGAALSLTSSPPFVPGSTSRTSKTDFSDVVTFATSDTALLTLTGTEQSFSTVVATRTDGAGRTTVETEVLATQTDENGMTTVVTGLLATTTNESGSASTVTEVLATQTDENGMTTVVTGLLATTTDESGRATTVVEVLATKTDESGKSTVVTELLATRTDDSSRTTVLATTTDAFGNPTSYYLVVEKSTASTTMINTVTAPAQSTGIPESTTAGDQLTLTPTSSAPASSTSHFDTSHLEGLTVIAGHFDDVDYVSALYLGPFIAVLFKMIWDIVFSSTKMMEPFYQLAKPGGTSSIHSLCADYLSTGLSWASVQFMLAPHWVMLLTTVIYGSIALLAPLASESMTVVAGGYCNTAVAHNQRCNPLWVVSVPVARGLEAFLGFTALMIAALITVSRRRKSGVYSNPSSIASMAALLGDRAVIDDLQSIDPAADADTLRVALAPKHYTLGTYETSTGIFRHGITKGSIVLSSKVSINSLDTVYSALANPANNFAIPERRPINWWAILDVAFLLTILALFSLILGYYLDGRSDPLNNFFNSGVFGPRFLVTLFASLIDSQWKRLEREVRVMQPYRRMSKRQAPPKTTILATMNGTPVTTFPVALWHGNFFHAWVAFVAILSEILIIAVSGVPYAGSQTHLSLLVSCYVSIGILGLMICTMAAMFVWRRSNPKMPRPPDTLASVWMYLCASRMVDDFHDMETIGSELRDIAVKRSGRKYWFGVALQKGQERWMIDHEREGSMVYY